MRFSKLRVSPKSLRLLWEKQIKVMHVAVIRMQIDNVVKDSLVREPHETIIQSCETVILL